ncbi:MAG TPA: serine/threonine-protein kinase [Polyangiaceae bacterium]|jgi:tRNA A-37 threonylcarbamoyl transferase component Bud32|nr:serine/threonine-protein kinase [Polyangiaceae bacterium]
MFDLANAEKIAEKDRSCLSRDEVLDVATGRVGADRLAGIHAHTGRCEPCQRLLSDVKDDVSSGAHTVGWDATFREGDVVGGRYRINGFIARGGMGEVYEAFDRELKERVALKTVLATSTDSVRALRRLRIEVQLAHRVSHPNVCRIYDLGAHVLPSTGATLNFLTMEFIDGESLRARTERGRLPVREAIAVARQLLVGLAAAHAAGILHRDFKSDNVMLRASKDEAPGAVIMDFGLASPIDPSLSRLTSGANALVGTPCYMSPEQLEGAQLSAASDLYSFGIVWFEMLTGQLPFSVRAPFDRLRRDAPRPSRLVDDIPSVLDAIVGRCLARTREARFTSAEQVLVALDAMEARPAAALHAPRRQRAVAIFAAGAAGAAVISWALFSPRSVTASSAVKPPAAAAAPDQAHVAHVESPVAPDVTASGEGATAPALAGVTAPPDVTAAKRDDARPSPARLHHVATAAETAAWRQAKAVKERSAAATKALVGSASDDPPAPSPASREPVAAAPSPAPAVAPERARDALVAPPAAVADNAATTRVAAAPAKSDDALKDPSAEPRRYGFLDPFHAARH